MSESEQDALLNKIEARRRWRVIRSRAILAILCVGSVAAGIALFAAA